VSENYPTGYANRLVSFDDLRAEHSERMHPEYARRLFDCIQDAAGLVGIGNGWRSRETQAANHQRSPRTFAPPGLSFHESHRFRSGIDAYAAVDTVGRDGRHDEAWDWMRDNAGRFGLRTFWNVNGEPWHTQCNDVPNGVSSWTGAGCPDPVSNGAAPLTTSASPYGLHPLNPDKPNVQIGWHGDLVSYIQTVILHKGGGEITVDGDFGPRTDGRVRDMQSFMKLPVTGVVDWNGSWQIVDHLAGNQQPAPPPSEVTAASDVQQVGHGLYWVQRGDSPWLVAQRVFGDGAKWQSLEPTDPPMPGFNTADHQIVVGGLRGVTAEVRSGDRVWSLVSRMCPGANPADLVGRFNDLNGGAHRILQPGDVVFLDWPG
jgi:peptidoglycan hydrolase-like protein with peptidoglycan-binding domain